MLKNRMQVRGIDIRDIACDGWGLTAEMAALNKLSIMGPLSRPLFKILRVS